MIKIGCPSSIYSLSDPLGLEVLKRPCKIQVGVVKNELLSRLEAEGSWRWEAKRGGPKPYLGVPGGGAGSPPILGIKWLAKFCTVKKCRSHNSTIQFSQVVNKWIPLSTCGNKHERYYCPPSSGWNVEIKSSQVFLHFHVWCYTLEPKI